MQPDGSESPLAVPAWWDARGRTFVWDATTINVGIVLVDDASFRFATADGDGFIVSLGDLAISWPRVLHTVRGCVVQVDSSKYRLYFARPLPGAPRIRRDQITAVTDGLAGVSQLGQLMTGPLGALSEVGELIAGLVALPGEFSDQKVGCRNGDRIRARLEQARR